MFQEKKKKKGPLTYKLILYLGQTLYTYTINK